MAEDSLTQEPEWTQVGELHGLPVRLCRNSESFYEVYLELSRIKEISIGGEVAIGKGESAATFGAADCVVSLAPDSKTGVLVLRHTAYSDISAVAIALGDMFKNNSPQDKRILLGSGLTDSTILMKNKIQELDPTIQIDEIPIELDQDSIPVLSMVVAREGSGGKAGIYCMVEPLRKSPRGVRSI